LLISFTHKKVTFVFLSIKKNAPMGRFF